MKRYGLLPAYLAALVAAASLSGCGANTLAQVSKDENCTVKGSIKGSYGSVTPTGTFTGSFLCKHSNSPESSKVAEPQPPQG